MINSRGYDFIAPVPAPLAEAETSQWDNVLENCHPLLRSAAIVGISAARHGVAQTQNTRAIEAIESGILLDSDGIDGVLTDALELHYHQRSDPVKLAAAGLYIVLAVVRATELISKSAIKKNQDFAGQTGVKFIQRATFAPVHNLQDSIALGGELNTRAVKNLQTRIHKRKVDPYKYTELVLAAGLYSPNEDACSTSIVLHTDIEDGKASASIASAERRGDFILPRPRTDFSDFEPYSRAIQKFNTL